jgi:hypothetical protein
LKQLTLTSAKPKHRPPTKIKAEIPYTRNFVPQGKIGSTWKTLSLLRDDYELMHKPIARKISKGMFIIDEQIRKKCIKLGKLIPIVPLEGFEIAKLDYSSAHLTPLAKMRLKELSQRFRKILRENNDTISYFVVSSLTRSQDQQNKICIRYPKACTKDHSTHSYGMAFDISFLRSDYKHLRKALKTFETVLSTMQNENKILLWPESGCIHVTATRKL